ncbi:MAG: hypothetical protein ACKO3L_01580, partial [Actinomycetota bacterium]
PERAQEVFHLFARQGLSNDEIAASLELTFANAQKLVQRVRDRIARSAGALLVARQGRKDCSDLNVLLVDWDGTFSPLWRKRIDRHVDECSACERKRAVLLQPGGAVMAAPYFAAPESLRSRIFDSVAAGVDLGLSALPKPPLLLRPVVLSSVAGVAFVAILGVVANNGTQAPEFVDSRESTAPAAPVDSTASADAAATVSSTVPPAPQTTMSATVPLAPQTTVSPSPVIATTTTVAAGSNSPSKISFNSCLKFGATNQKTFAYSVKVSDPQGIASVRMQLSGATKWHAAGSFGNGIWFTSIDKLDTAATKATVVIEATDKAGGVTTAQIAVYATTCP